MPKQKTANHTKIRGFRLGAVAEGRLEEMEASLGVDQTTLVKLAIAELHARQSTRKNPRKSDQTS